MPRTAQGTTFVSDGSVHARVVVAPKKYLTRSLAGIVAEHETTAARLWASTLQELVTTLRDLGRSGEVTRAVETAIRVGREEPKGGLERVRASLGKLRADLGEQQVRIPKKGTRATTPTVKVFGQRWTAGELHREFPDHVPEKKSAGKDAGNLRTHVYDVIGHVPLAELTLKHAQEVMRRIPEGRMSATRRHVAQVMVRLCNLAVYPCEILKASPLPKGFLPKVKSRVGGYLYPKEDAALLAQVDVPLVNRMLYGFLAREGMRKEEALTLTWSDLDLTTGTVTLDENKTDDPRAWAAAAGVVAALKAWRGNAKDNALVFPVADPEHLPSTLREHLELAKVKRPQLFEHNAKRTQMNIHGLRATFVTHALANGKTETWCCDRTGHGTSTMVNRYRRQPRTIAELGPGPLTPLHDAIPEFVGAREGPKSVPTVSHEVP